MKPPWWLGNTASSLPSSAASASEVRQVKVPLDSMPAATTTRVRADVSLPNLGRYAVTAFETPDSNGSSREPSSSVGMPNIAGSGSGCAANSSVSSPCQAPSATNAAIPAPKPPAR